MAAAALRRRGLTADFLTVVAAAGGVPSPIALSVAVAAAAFLLSGLFAVFLAVGLAVSGIMLSLAAGDASTAVSSVAPPKSTAEARLNSEARLGFGDGLPL